MEKVMQVVNSKTGEIYDVARPVIPYRTILDASEYQDPEVYEPDSSMTDLTGFEPLSVVVARCMRTMKSPSGVVSKVLDVHALQQEAHETGIYEAENATNVDEAFATLDPTDAPGFDLAEGNAILGAVNDNMLNNKKEELSTTSTNEQALKSQANEDNAVGNSARDDELELSERNEKLSA